MSKQLGTRQQRGPSASIIILAKNEANHIQKCLEGVFSQTYRDFEAILVDSGSTDGTLQIASRFPVSIVRIRPDEFHHGRTRNLGVDLAKGRWVVYLTADAYPGNAKWLENLLIPFEDASVSAVFGRQVPRDDANPAEKAFLIKTYPKVGKTLNFKNLGSNGPGGIVLLSDVCSAYKRSVARFSERAEMSEDQEIAARILRGGGSIVYAPESFVYHSHNYTLKSLFWRYFRSGKTIRNFSSGTLSILPSLKYAVELFAASMSYRHRNCQSGWILSMFDSLLYNCTKILGFIVGYMTS